MKLQLIADIAESRSKNKIPFHDTDSQEAANRLIQKERNRIAGYAGRIILTENR